MNENYTMCFPKHTLLSNSKCTDAQFHLELDGSPGSYFLFTISKVWTVFKKTNKGTELELILYIFYGNLLTEKKNLNNQNNIKIDNVMLFL